MEKRSKKQIKTVKDAIGDLPKIKPIKSINRISHKVEGSFSEHEPRSHNERDIKIFQILAEDIESGRNEFKSIESLKKIYEKYTSNHLPFTNIMFLTGTNQAIQFLHIFIKMDLGIFIQIQLREGP